MTYHLSAYPRAVACDLIGNGRSSDQRAPRIGPWLALVGLSLPGVASAQTAPAASGEGTTTAQEPAAQYQSGVLGEVLVTATRRSERAMSVPVAVAAYSGDTLTALGVNNVQALQIATPSVVINNTSAFAQPYIRGVGSRLLSNGFDPSVATYIDGQYIARQSAINLELADIDRVEVLKGPQGVLFGRNASAGAIRIITNDVANEFEGSVKVGYGNYNRRMAQGVINVPFTDTLGVRVSGDISKRDGYAENIVPSGIHQWNDRHYSSIRAKIKWEPSDWFDARLSQSHFYSNDLDGAGVNQVGRLDLSTGLRLGGITGVGQDQVASDLQNKSRKQDNASELDLHFKLGSVDLTTVSTYDDLESRLGFEVDGTSARLIDSVIFEQSRTFTQEVQLASARSEPIEWLIGGYYFRNNTNYDTPFDRSTATPASPFGSAGQQHVITDSIAGFGQLAWKIADRVKLIAGGRYTRDRKTVDVVASPHLNAVTTTIVPYSDAATFNKFTPSVTIQYDVDNLLLYAKYARGFKSGGFSYSASRSATGTYPPVVQPEVLDSYELGFKGDLYDHRLRAVLSAYYYDYKNLQLSKAGAPGTIITDNAADAELYGLDADLTWFATNNLTLATGFAVEHSEYTNYIATANVYRGLLPGTLTQAGMTSVSFDANGNQLLRAPKFSAFANINYSIPVDSGAVPINLSYAYKSSYLFDFIYDPPGITQTGTTAVLRQKGYSLVNGRIGYESSSKRWLLSAFVNNMFDKKYFNDVAASSVGIRASYAPPRTFGADFERRF